MKSKSSRVLKSFTLTTKPSAVPEYGTLAAKRVTVSLIGADAPAAEIGTALIRNGVSRLHIYDPAEVSHRHSRHSSAPVYQAAALAYCLAKMPGNPQTKITGHPFPFNAVHAFACDLGIVINPDHRRRSICNDYFRATQQPYLIVTLTPDGKEGSVLVHQAKPSPAGLRALPRPPTNGKAHAVHLSGAIDVGARVITLVSDSVDGLILGGELLWSCAHLSPTGEQYR